MRVWDVGYSQDVWAFCGNIKSTALATAGKFFFGVPGCDNHFSHELHTAGYTIRNPAFDVPNFHVHSTGRRTATNSERFRVKPPYMYLTPTDLVGEQKLTEALTMQERSAAFRARRNPQGGKLNAQR